MNGFLEEWRRKSGKWQKITYSRERPNAISAEFLGELFGQTFGQNKFGHFMLFRLFGRNAEIWPFGTLSAFRPNVRPNSGIFAECSAKYLVEFWLNILRKCQNSVFRHYFGVSVLFRHFGRISVSVETIEWLPINANSSVAVGLALIGNHWSHVLIFPQNPRRAVEKWKEEVREWSPSSFFFHFLAPLEREGNRERPNYFGWVKRTAFYGSICTGSV